MTLLLIVQLLILNHIHLLGYGTPIVIVFLTLKFHRGASRIGLLLWGFAIGLVYDVFSNTMGMGMASCTLLAMLQPSLLKLYVPHDAADEIRPSFRTMGVTNYLAYTFTSLLLFHIVFYALDAFTISNWQYTLIGIGLGTVLAFVVSLLVGFLISSKTIEE